MCGDALMLRSARVPLLNAQGGPWFDAPWFNAPTAPAYHVSTLMVVLSWCSPQSMPGAYGTRSVSATSWLEWKAVRIMRPKPPHATVVERKAEIQLVPYTNGNTAGARRDTAHRAPVGCCHAAEATWHMGGFASWSGDAPPPVRGWGGERGRVARSVGGGRAVGQWRPEPHWDVAPRQDHTIHGCWAGEGHS
jgi:hypothetical protein